jgi:hypothetical protein
VICGADEKVVYAADWSALAPAGESREGAFDSLDVGDLVDERAHGYEAPVPSGGWVVGNVLALADGTRRFDAGRIVPEGRAESFTVRAGPSSGSAVLVLRTDGEGEGLVRVAVERGAAARVSYDVLVPRRAADAWHELRVLLGDVRSGDRVRIHAARGAFHDYHVWIVVERGGGT